MRKNGNHSCFAAWGSIAVGILILLALVLPAKFWWLVCAAAFVTGGVLLLRNR